MNEDEIYEARVRRLRELEENTAVQRGAMRRALHKRLRELNLDTPEGFEAVAMVMEVASTFDPRHALYDLGDQWNTWTFGECAVSTMRSGMPDGR